MVGIVSVDYGARLLPHHAELLAASAIDPEVARERGYRSADTKAALTRLGFGSAQALAPALVVPLWGVTGEVAGYQARPDEPRSKDGRIVKYESPAKQRMVLDVHPRVRPHLGDPSRLLFVTEGARKADAAVSAGLDCVGLSGVWAWRGTNDEGGKVALAAWETVALNGRRVVIAFDSDVMLNPKVHDALGRLGSFLEGRGAEVAYAYLPSGPGGEKVGLDDFLAVGHSVDDLLALVTRELRRAHLNGSTHAPPPRERAERKALAEVVEVFERWLNLDDLAPLYAVLGTYAGNLLDGDPIWLMIVAGSGRGKSEIASSLSGLDNVRASSSLSGEAALLSGTAAKDRTSSATGGLLREIGEHGLLVLKDFTSILSMHREARSQVLAALREIFDGYWARLVGGEGGRRLEWRGKCGLVAGSTSAIDAAHAVISQMGERFLMVRLPEGDRDELARRALEQVGLEPIMRAELTEAVRGLFDHGLPRQPSPLCDRDQRRIIDLAGLVSRARSPVQRDYQGEIDLVLDPEAPTRLSKCLAGLRLGLSAIGLSDEAAWTVVVRVGLDSIPKLRRSVMDALAAAEGQMTTSAVAVAVAHPTRTTQRALEDLEAHHIVERTAGGEGKANLWTLETWAAERYHAARSGTLPEMSGGTHRVDVCVGGSNEPNTPNDDISGKVGAREVLTW